jgi:predicted transcriptional regulator
MEVLWRHGPSTTREVLERLPAEERKAHSTVRTILRILEGKGYVGHRTEDRRFVYFPRVGRAETRRNAVRHLVSRFFDGSPELLVLNVLELEQVEPAELVELKRRIAAAEEDAP